MSLAAGACAADEPYFTLPNEQFPAPQGEVRVADWSLALAKATCSFKERCNDPELTLDSYRGEACLTYFQRKYEEAIDVAGLVAEGHMQWDPVAYGRCVALEAGAGCRDQAPRRPCYAANGQLEEDDACQFDAECGAELFCDAKLGCGGHCRRTLDKGNECAHQFQCGPGLSCLATDENQECHPTPKRGMECYDDGPSCGPNMNCQTFEGFDHTGSCQPADPMWSGPELVKAGERCGSDDLCPGSTECRPTEVEPGGRYAYATCISAVADGKRCLRADEWLHSACKEGSHCEAEADLEYGRCVSRVEQGEPCAGEDSHECREGQRCDPTSSTCQPSHHARSGEACLTHDECYSGRCYGKVCLGATDCR
jgi:hypothetical protein